MLLQALAAPKVEEKFGGDDFSNKVNYMGRHILDHQHSSSKNIVSKAAVAE